LRRRKEKPRATVQLDLDGLWAVLGHLGHPGSLDEDPLFRDALPRFLRLFTANRIRATCFVVGSDLGIPWKAELLEEANAQGHEIAAHSQSHPRSFHRLSRVELRSEVKACSRSIEDRLGVRPVGFRAPSYLIRAELLDVLEEENYLYDSSLLPSWFVPIQRVIQARYSGSVPSPGSGKPSVLCGLFPTIPYHPSVESIGKRGSRPLWEVPVTPYPILRVPFHESYLLAASPAMPAMSLFRAGMFLLRRGGGPVNFVFHLADLAEPLRDRRLRGHPGFDIPLTKKMSLCSQVLQYLGERYRVLPTHELLQALDPDREAVFG